MKKLTKEQAQWLIEKLDMYHVHTDCNLICEACEIKYGEVKSVINQCTEKEFPKFILLPLCNGQITLDKHTDNRIYINVVNEYGYLTAKEFKQFAEGVNKIMEYLNEKVD